MVNENWLKVRAIFDEALRRPPAERHQFIHDSCDGEQTLMAEVESLLSSLDRADSFMETPAIAKVAEAMDADTHQLQPGKSFGHYEIIRLIGKGGMGEVYLAQDTNLGRKVALKLLPAEFTQDAERVRRFMQEARAASLLNHPNILTIHEIGQIDQRHFIVSEFVEGETLRQQLARGPLDLQAALEVAVQVASALAAAHQAGIVHRDIKPENIVLRPDGLLKVLDFGLAKLSRKDEGGGLKDEASTLLQPHPSTFSPPPSTIPGIVMGTPRYMSPEQARGMKLDHRTDIFSLGVLLYEMLAGRRPFEGATISDVIAALLTTEPSPLREHCATASAELERIVGKCLAKECEARYQSAEELSAELKTLPTNKQAQEVAVTQELESSGVKFASRRWIVVAALAALLMVGLVWFLVGRRAPAMLSDPIESLAVLPPRPLQINGRDEALELGTTSTLITRLGSLRQLIVRPESAVGRYTRHDQDPLAAGREQKVDAVLDTRYQRSGDKISGWRDAVVGHA
jgi:eukaryotic-like serine/threonine-protein kinase